MKKTISIILVLCMMLSMCALSVSAEDVLLIAPTAAPEGTAITTAEEFAAMAADGNYYLANDITVSATYASDFAGVLDGNGKTITTSAPLFTNLGSATIKNLKIAGNIVSDTSNTAALAQSIVAGSTILIENVINDCNVTVSIKLDAAGFIAFADYAQCYGSTVTIKNCTNNGAITCGWRAGGILGYFAGSNDTSTPITINIENCVNNGTINSTESYCGGIVGRFCGDKKTTGASTLNITATTNNGKVTAAISQFGGFVGYNCGATIIKNSVNNADLTATPGTNMTVGGFIGASNCKTKGEQDGLQIINCINYGKISTTSKGGGIVGKLGNGKSSATANIVEGCINYGEVTVENCDATGTTQVGGIVGYAYGGNESDTPNTVKNCVNFGNITGETTAEAGKNYVGGILGYVNGTKFCVENCLNAAQITMASADKTQFVLTVYNNNDTGSTAMINNYSVASEGVTLAEYNGAVELATTTVTALDADLATKLGAGWKMGEKSPEPIIEGEIGGSGADFSAYAEKPVETEPAPVDPVPTGDSALIFAVVAVLSLIGVAVVAKRREN